MRRAAGLILAAWVLTLGIFVEGYIESHDEKRVTKERFIEGKDEVYVSCFVEQREWAFFGVPYVFFAVKPAGPYTLNVYICALAEAHPAQAQIQAKITSATVEYSDGTFLQLVSDPIVLSSKVGSRQRFDRDVTAFNAKWDALPSRKNFVTRVEGDVGGIAFSESVSVKVATRRSVYPGWYKLLYLDHF